MYGAYLPRKPRRVLLLGSGALQIGQAGEFDYSGSQALKALREEGIFTVLINPNIATVQTGSELADRVYLHAVIPEFVEKILVEERIDGVLLSFGGQTALNCGLELHDRGVFERLGVRVLGTPVESIRITEDRRLFAERMTGIGVDVARSLACRSVEEGLTAAETIGLPVMLRAGFALGGKGSGVVETRAALEGALRRAFSAGAQQILVEECLRGWKEIEYEVVRDFRDNCITVCNMENLDPLGIHTGESIVVAPSQTLDDAEYQMLRSIAIRAIRDLGIVGECNIQFALDPQSRAYRVIEVNARLSRSSALASKATGYPLAYIAAKLALGYTLAELPNGITRQTCAFFEPALDYIVCKVPRWDLTKFHGAEKRIGSEMKSVGEVMAIGRTFPEAIQKALRMLDIGVDGLAPGAFAFDDLREELKNATPRRIFAVANALREGLGIEEICEITRIDRWFVAAIAQIVAAHGELEAAARVSGAPHAPDAPHLRRLKELGFSDRAIENTARLSPGAVRKARKEAGITPHVAQIDTLAGEFPAQTNYLYLTYHARESDVRPSGAKKVMILGSGVYRIGSSVEFDWCCVSAARAAAELGYETVTVNYNPETVSTDYDTCDRLYFEEISLESVLDLIDIENPDGVVVSMGGQIPNNLAVRLAGAGARILGTAPEDIDRAEDRRKFSAMLDRLGIAQPAWFHVTDVSDADRVVERLGGFPVLVRPSYVLSGAAMSVAHEVNELRLILARAKRVSQEHPVVISKFETHARELEIDAVADGGEIVAWAVEEHIEDAGVHSGDATLVLPPQTLYLSTIRKARHIATRLAAELKITGPFNVQFLARHNDVKVIECNLRASRSFPFVSKVLGVNFAEEAMRCMLGERREVAVAPLEIDHVGVKVPMFSFSRLAGVDPVPGIEMASTGEAGCLGADVHEALLHGLLATGFRFPKRGVLLSLGPVGEKYLFQDELRVIAEDLKLPIFATPGTAEALAELGIACTPVAKDDDAAGVTGMSLIESARVDLVINVPRSYDSQGRPDGYLIRRRAVDCGVPLITDLKLARAVVDALRNRKSSELTLRPLTEIVRAKEASGGRARARLARAQPVLEDQ
jgi:carbamoyl-phosphate synthase large subunit